MKLEIFAVRDVKTDQYANPMFLISKGQAIRSLADEVNRAEANNQLHKHPGDFELFHLGNYNTETAQFQTHAPKSVVTAIELVEKSNG